METVDDLSLPSSPSLTSGDINDSHSLCQLSNHNESEETGQRYWKFGDQEDSQGRRQILVQNPFGSKHPMSTLFSKSCHLMDETNFTIFPEISIEESSHPLSAIDNSPSYLPEDNIHIKLNEELTEVETRFNNDDLSKILFCESCEIITASTNSLNQPATGILEITKSKIVYTKKGHPSRESCVLTISSERMENDDFLWACQNFPSTQWNTDDVRDILLRRFQLRNIAVELFFTSRKSVLINLHHQATAFELIRVIRNIVKPPHIETYCGYHPIQKMPVPGTPLPPCGLQSFTIAWLNRDISNFQYLMQLNRLAGRSYHDLGQYPVFPWVIADYTSTNLKLRDPSTFRNLSWPMGAQKPLRRQDLARKYEDLNFIYQSAITTDERNIADPPSHYGSHYSNARYVLWYLMRAEPFTSLHIQRQGGHFGKIDQHFDSVSSAYLGCISNPSEVKELIPEFYYSPEIFENANQLDLGQNSLTGQPLGDILLPPWASNSLDFVRMNRKALESEYVSRNLHHWIDLIFGYKQRPPHLFDGGNAAVEACNVFSHLSYPDSAGMESLLETKKDMYYQYVDRIQEFGQTPAQLFRFPHPQRSSIGDSDIFWPFASVVLGVDTVLKGDEVLEKPDRVVACPPYQISSFPIVFIGETTGKLVTIDTSGVIGNHSWQVLAADIIPPYRFKLNLPLGSDSNGSFIRNYSIFPSKTVPSKERQIPVPFLNPLNLPDEISLEPKTPPISKKRFLQIERHPRVVLKNSNPSPHRTRMIDEHISPQLFTMIPTTKLLFSCGYLDFSFKMTYFESGHVLQSIIAHKDLVTCLTLAEEFGQTWLITGSRDCTLMVWDVDPKSDCPLRSEVPLFLLSGHENSITTVSASSELDAIVSGSIDGIILVHSLREGLQLRRILIDSAFPPEESLTPKNIHWVCVTKEGYVVVNLIDEQLLCSFTINGKLVAIKNIHERLHCLLPSEDGQVLITGGENCLVVLRWIHNLELANDGPRNGLEAVLDGKIEESEARFSSPIRSLLLTKYEKHLLVGTQDGEMRILYQDPGYLHRRLNSKLTEIGIL